MMHKVLHSFGDWELDTRHMTRLEKSIYFDARTLYLKDGKPLTDDLPLLERLLMCHSDDEKQALAFVLSHKFTHDKKRRVYRHKEWDLILKNYKFRHQDTDNGGTDSGTKAEHIGTDSGTQQRKEKHQNKVNYLRKLLADNGIKTLAKSTISELTALCNEHKIFIDWNKAQQKAEHIGTDSGTKAEHIGTPKNHAITNNQEPITINQEPKSNSNAPTQKTQKVKAQTQTFDPIAFLQDNGVDDKTATDFVKYKKSKLKKGDEITEQMLVLIKNQAQKTGKISFGDALKIMMATGKWSGFQADWSWQSWHEAVLITENRPIPDWLKQPKFGGDDDPLAVNRHWQSNNESKVVGGFTIPPTPTGSNIQKW